MILVYLWSTRRRIPSRNSHDRNRQVSSRAQIAFPFLQGRVPATGRQRPRPDTLDLQYFAGPTIDSESHARASVSVAPVCLRPLPIFKRRPVPIAFNLISALRSDGPLSLPVVQPKIDTTIKALVLFATARRRSPQAHACWTACASFDNEDFASPYNIPVFDLKKSGFSSPENPLPLPRLSTTTLCARSTSMMGIPAIGLFGLSRASGLTTSLAPITTATSVACISGLICSSS